MKHKYNSETKLTNCSSLFNLRLAACGRPLLRLLAGGGDRPRAVRAGTSLRGIYGVGGGEV